jgi:hypothetical protein
MFNDAAGNPGGPLIERPDPQRTHWVGFDATGHCIEA